MGHKPFTCFQGLNCFVSPVCQFNCCILYIFCMLLYTYKNKILIKMLSFYFSNKYINVWIIRWSFLLLKTQNQTCKMKYCRSACVFLWFLIHCLINKIKTGRGNNVGLSMKVEPAASATEQINLKRNPVHLLLTSMAMEITENYFKMRTRPPGHSDHTWECCDVSSPMCLLQ